MAVIYASSARRTSPYSGGTYAGNPSSSNVNFLNQAANRALNQAVAKTNQQGSVLGAFTGGGSGGTLLPTAVPQQDTQSLQSSVSDQENRIRGEIEGGYNNYFSQLDSIMNSTLPTQKTAMEGIAESQGRQATSTLGSQLAEGKSTLAGERTKTTQEQEKSLLGLSEDIRNLFQAGQMTLGARGAGDSSAANMYSYAISKMGTKERGNIMNQAKNIQAQINDKEFKLQNTYNTEVNNIKEQVSQKAMEIAQWFAQAQQQIQQAKAQGQLQKGQDLASLSQQALTMAQNQLLAFQQEAANKRSMLDQWAMNNSSTIQGLKANLATVGSFANPGIATQGLASNALVGGNTGSYSPYVPGNTYSEQKNKYVPYAGYTG